MTDPDRSVAPVSPDELGLRTPEGVKPTGAIAGEAAGTPPRETGRRTTYVQNPPQRRSRGPVYAALDLGTNNCRLLIARPHEHSFRVLDGGLANE